MVSRKKAEQGATGAAKKATDQEAVKPKRKTGKAPAGNEVLETRPAVESQGGAPSRRKAAAEKKTAPPPVAPGGEPKPKTPARKTAAKAETTPKPETKKAAARPAARKPAAKAAEEAPLPAPAPQKKAPAKKIATAAEPAKTEEPKPAPAKRTAPAAKRLTARPPAATPPAAAKATPEKPARARSARKIDAAAATARPEPEDTAKPTRRAAPQAAKPVAETKTVPPVGAAMPAVPEPVMEPAHHEVAPPAAAAVPAAALPQETPASLGVTRIVLMIRDPEWLYAYWEISAADRETHAIGRPQGAPPLLLRVYDLGVEEQASDTGSSFDLTVLPDASGWYVHVPQSGGQWCVALGYLNYDGEFVAVAASNVVTTPSPLHADWNEQTWGPVSEEQHLAEVAGLVGGAGLEEEVMAPGEPGGPSRLVRRAARLMSYLKGASEQVPRPGASEQVPRLGASEQVPRLVGASEQVPRLGASEQVPRMGASEQFAAAPGSGLMMGRPFEISGEKGKTFWLQVYTELIVYGATEPDASVTVQGQPIRLRADGTFTLRFALPDGEQVIPVRAVNADGDMERTITPIVTKRTV